MSKASFLFEQIESEYKRLRKEIEVYEKERDALPKGALHIVNNRYVYCYLRVDGKNTSEYVGLKNSDKVRERRAKIKKRSFLDAVIRDLKKEYREVGAYYRAGLRFHKSEPEQEQDVERG